MQRQPYGKGSRGPSKRSDILSHEQVLDAMRFLGYQTHDEQGKVTDDCHKTAAALARKVKEDVMLPTWIAQEIAKHRP